MPHLDAGDGAKRRMAETKTDEARGTGHGELSTRLMNGELPSHGGLYQWYAHDRLIDGVGVLPSNGWLYEWQPVYLQQLLKRVSTSFLLHQEVWNG